MVSWSCLDWCKHRCGRKGVRLANATRKLLGWVVQYRVLDSGLLVRSIKGRRISVSGRVDGIHIAGILNRRRNFSHTLPVTPYLNPMQPMQPNIASGQRSSGSQVCSQSPGKRQLEAARDACMDAVSRSTSGNSDRLVSDGQTFSPPTVFLSSLRGLQDRLIPKQSSTPSGKPHEPQTAVCVIYRAECISDTSRPNSRFDPASTYRFDSSPRYVTSLSGAIDSAVPGRKMIRAMSASATIWIRCKLYVSFEEGLCLEPDTH